MLIAAQVSFDFMKIRSVRQALGFAGQMEKISASL
jgi:hypothetical protein